MISEEHLGKLVRQRAENLSCRLFCPEITKGIKQEAALAEAPGDPGLPTCQPSQAPFPAPPALSHTHIARKEVKPCNSILAGFPLSHALLELSRLSEIRPPD